jgi:hypothetical protein
MATGSNLITKFHQKTGAPDEYISLESYTA